MTFEEYWEQDPLKVIPYLEAYNLKRKAMNEQAWLQGQYFAYSVASAMNSKVKYPSRPLPLTKKELELQRMREQKRRVEDAKRRLLEIKTGRNK